MTKKKKKTETEQTMINPLEGTVADFGSSPNWVAELLDQGKEHADLIKKMDLSVEYAAAILEAKTADEQQHAIREWAEAVQDRIHLVEGEPGVETLRKHVETALSPPEAPEPLVANHPDSPEGLRARIVILEGRVKTLERKSGILITNRPKNIPNPFSEGETAAYFGRFNMGNKAPKKKGTSEKS